MHWLPALILFLAPPEIFPVTAVEQPRKSPQQSEYYVVVFTADWCSPCQRMKRDTIPVLKSRGIPVTVVNTDRDRVAPSWNISAVPTTWIVDRRTRKPVRRWTGFVSASTITRGMESAVQPSSDAGGNILPAKPVSASPRGSTGSGESYEPKEENRTVETVDRSKESTVGSGARGTETSGGEFAETAHAIEHLRQQHGINASGTLIELEAIHDAIHMRESGGRSSDWHFPRQRSLQ